MSNQSSSTAQSIRLADESNEYESVSVEAVPPTWRDIWKILRGTYKPVVRRRKVLTVAGASKVLKETWASGEVRDALNQPSPLMDLLKRD
jgi:hypothetical protein